MLGDDTAPPCVGLTPRATRLLARVREALEVDGSLAFVISGGCCGGTNPVLCRKDSVLIGFDVPLGEVAGVPLFAHPEHARYLRRDRFVIDALEDGRSDTFSLEASYGGRFVLRELPATPGTV
jgi:uncharacterized protein (DUF779 family)